LQRDAHFDQSPRVLVVGRALPRNYLSQEALIAALRGLWGARHFNIDRLLELHRTARVSGRHLALPLEAYAELDTFAKCNDAWIEAALDLGEAALCDALAGAGLSAAEVDHIFFATVTGIATPSIDARLVNRLGMKRSVKRTPIFGLGCVAGAAGMARASDYLRAYPDEVAVLLSVELCSLTLQREDVSVPNVIASGLFGDGAAAVLLGGSRAVPQACGGKGPRVIAARSFFYRDTERVLGWDVVDSGFKVVLSASIPEVVREHVAKDVDEFLGGLGFARGDIQHYLVHAAGPKVLQAIEGGLSLSRDALAASWRSLGEVGNLSSASVLFVLGDVLASAAAREGDLGLLVGMGPGFCSEMVLLAW